jgi:hypothetical protein
MERHVIYGGRDDAKCEAPDGVLLDEAGGRRGALEYLGPAHAAQADADEGAGVGHII